MFMEQRVDWKVKKVRKSKITCNEFNIFPWISLQRMVVTQQKEVLQADQGSWIHTPLEAKFFPYLALLQIIQKKLLADK